MSVVDKQHAAQAVTSKGRIYMFDAVECMVNYLSESEEEHAYLLVNDYSNPGELVNAEGAFYLISKNLPSPMGAFLTAFSSEEAMKSKMTEVGGKSYRWNELNKVLNN